MKESKRVWRGRWLVMFAAILWSTSGFFAKAPWFDGWPAESRGVLLAFFRSLFALGLLVPFVRQPVFRWPMIPMCVCFAGMVWTFMSGMVHGPAANAIWLQYLCPVWVMLGGRLLLQETIRPADTRMFVICVSGVSFILIMELSRGGTPYATFLGTSSGVMMAVVILCMRTMRDVNAAVLITLNHAATCALLFPWVWSSYQPIDTRAYVALGFFGLFQMSFPYLLFARGLRTITSVEASVLTLIEPVLVPLWVYLAWSQHDGYRASPWWTWVGAAVIATGLVQRYAFAVRRQRRGTSPDVASAAER
ncbi:MAG: DMT family transporter [Planctomycetota bacterium]